MKHFPLFEPLIGFNWWSGTTRWAIKIRLEYNLLSIFNNQWSIIIPSMTFFKVNWSVILCGSHGQDAASGSQEWLGLCRVTTLLEESIWQTRTTPSVSDKRLDTAVLSTRRIPSKSVLDPRLRHPTLHPMLTVEWTTSPVRLTTSSSPRVRLVLIYFYVTSKSQHNCRRSHSWS